MLERIEILGRERKELRRDVRLSCEVESDYWDESLPHRLVDLSPSGGFVETPFPLGPDEELDVRFHPPRSRTLYWLRARVVRSSLGRRHATRDLPGMGLEFLDLTSGDRKDLAAQLVGIPPRVPVTRTRKSGAPGAKYFGVVGEELVFVGELLVDESKRVTVSELIRDDLDHLRIRALAPMLY